MVDRKVRGVSRREAAEKRLQPRSEIDRLATHISHHYGVEITQVTQLDLGAFRVDLVNGASWVARVFPAVRPETAAKHDVEVLRWLERCEFASERLACAEPLSQLAGQSVVVTEFVEGVPRRERADAVRRFGGLRAVGEALGRLQTLPYGDAVDWPGGSWHHLTDGFPEDEIVAVAELLAESRERVPAGEDALYSSLRRHVEALDAGTGLPEAVVHPDFVLVNIVAPAKGDSLVIVDWVGTGVGPRVWSLAFALFAATARSHERADRFLDGYRRHVQLGPDELSRLAAVARARPTVLAVWDFCMGRKSLGEALANAEQAAGLASLVAQRAQLAFAGAARAKGSKHATGWSLERSPLADFDARALWLALDAERRTRGLSWVALAAEIWEQSAELNRRRHDHPISTSTIAHMAKGSSISCQHALFMLRWLGKSPEDFLGGSAPLAKKQPLPPAGKDRRLRWDLRLLHAELDSARRERGATWAQLASEIGCEPGQLTGLRNAKFATGINLAMRAVQWMGRPAADFVYAAEW